MTRCLFWVSEGKSSWSSALSPLLKKRTQAKHWRYAERPDVKVAFGLLPFYKRAILKKAKSRCLFFKKCILIFLKCEDISRFRTSRKKSTHNGVEKLQLIAQNSQRPSFEWFLRAKSGLKHFLCVLLKKFLTVNHLGLILYFIKVWSYRGEKIPPCVRSPLLLSLVFSCFDFDLGEFMMKSYFLCDFFFPHNFFMPHEFWLLLNVILLCVRYIWILFKQLK